MKTITLDDMNQEDFDAAAHTVISGIKAYNRKLDTRDGTVLRDLLVNPEAAIEGTTAGQIAEVRKCTSLKRISEAQQAGDTVDQDDVDAILSNFNIKPHAGTPARGDVKVVVSDGSVAYSIPEGFVFSIAEGLEFAADSQVVAMTVGTANPSVKATTTLYKGAAGYFFLVPVTATAAGSAGNISQGTALTPSSQISAFVMAEAYKDFCGGADTQDLESVIDSIPTGLSIRGFVNKTAVEGMIRSEFDDGDHPVVAVSAAGYGNPVQIRDRHNVFGVGVGGRVDVYVRNFTDLSTSTKTLKGAKVEHPDGTVGYAIDIPPGTFPGAYWIKSVADPFNPLSSSSADVQAEEGEEEEVLESLAFEASRTADVSGTWHDMDQSNVVEAYGTVWSGFSVELQDVPPDVAAPDESTPSAWSDERDFKVTAYCLPQSVELQGYVDRDDVRNIATDVVVRCPVMCSVSVNAVVKYDPRKPVDEARAAYDIRSYINTLGFVGRLTRSEIVQILKNLGAVSVEMPVQDMLYGELYDAAGVRHVLSGDALDIDSIENGGVMLSRDTVVFVAEPRNIQITMTPNS